MLLVAIKDCNLNDSIQSAEVPTRTETFLAVIRGLLHADYCAVVVHSLDDT